MLIAQLETQHRAGQMTMQRLWFYLQPSLRTMEVLADVADTVFQVGWNTHCRSWQDVLVLAVAYDGRWRWWRPDTLPLRAAELTRHLRSADKQRLK